MAKKAPYDRGRIQVLALRDVIQDQVARGWSLKAIHAQAKLDIGYSAFRKLVVKYIGPATPQAIEKTHERQTSKTEHSGHADPDLIRKLTRG